MSLKVGWYKEKKDNSYRISEENIVSPLRFPLNHGFQSSSSGFIIDENRVLYKNRNIRE